MKDERRKVCAVYRAELNDSTWIYEACISMHVPYKRHSDAYTPYIRLSTSDDLSNIGLAIYVNFSYR